MIKSKKYRHSEETKRKIGKANSIALKGNIPWNKGIKIDREKFPNFGHFKKHSLETRKKMSKSHKGIQTGTDNNRWKGGKYRNKHGYCYVMFPGHLRANKAGYVKNCNLVMEKLIGRKLNKDEVAHHKGTHFTMGSYEDKGDDSKENLQLFSSRNTHTGFHAKIRGHIRFPKGVKIGYKKNISKDPI